MIRRLVTVTALVVASICASVAEKATVEDQPEFLKSEGECLQLRFPDRSYSSVDIVEAQYRWLATHYHGYKFSQHAKPKPSYLRKLGCNTGRGSILGIKTTDGEDVDVCFCLPAKTPRNHARRHDAR